MEDMRVRRRRNAVAQEPVRTAFCAMACRGRTTPMFCTARCRARRWTGRGSPAAPTRTAPGSPSPASGVCGGLRFSLSRPSARCPARRGRDAPSTLRWTSRTFPSPDGPYVTAVPRQFRLRLARRAHRAGGAVHAGACDNPNRHSRRTSMRPTAIARSSACSPPIPRGWRRFPSLPSATIRSRSFTSRARSRPPGRAGSLSCCCAAKAMPFEIAWDPADDAAYDPLDYGQQRSAGGGLRHARPPASRRATRPRSARAMCARSAAAPARASSPILGYIEARPAPTAAAEQIEGTRT